MDDRKRAVAYIRVSTKSDAQLHSFGYQESYWRQATSMTSLESTRTSVSAVGRLTDVRNCNG